jgi:hypothetical protein
MALTKVVVTQDHIFDGVREDGRSCPIAIALREMGYQDVYVYDHFFTYQYGGQLVARDLPDEAVLFVDLFDNYKHGLAKPFEFEVDLMPLAPEKTTRFTMLQSPW